MAKENKAKEYGQGKCGKGKQANTPSYMNVRREKGHGHANPRSISQGKISVIISLQHMADPLNSLA